MTRHPLWRPFHQPSDEEIAAARVCGPRLPEQVEVVAPDAAWPGDFARLRDRIRTALGDRALDVRHVGSTSIPGLWAKPVIDVDLTVADSADEAAYLPRLEAAGFVLRVREPEWEQHRCLRGADPRANVHVWSPGAQEPARHLAFRQWLLDHEDVRGAYGDLKRGLAEQGFTDVMHYNNAKAALIYDIYEQIFTADMKNPHDPQPRSAGVPGSA